MIMFLLKKNHLFCNTRFVLHYKLGDGDGVRLCGKVVYLFQEPLMKCFRKCIGTLIFVNQFYQQMIILYLFFVSLVFLC